MATPGDVVATLASVAQNAFLDIQPPVGQEWVIHNFYFGAAVEIYVTDGTNTIKVDSDSSSGAKTRAYTHASNTFWYRLKNVSGSTAIYGYDGIQTK